MPEQIIPFLAAGLTITLVVIGVTNWIKSLVKRVVLLEEKIVWVANKAGRFDELDTFLRRPPAPQSVVSSQVESTAIGRYNVGGIGALAERRTVPQWRELIDGKNLDPCVCGHPYGWHVIHGGACTVGRPGGGRTESLPVCGCTFFLAKGGGA